MSNCRDYVSTILFGGVLQCKTWWLISRILKLVDFPLDYFNLDREFYQRLLQAAPSLDELFDLLGFVRHDRMFIPAPQPADISVSPSFPFQFNPRAGFTST
jgi:hypothetical protein